jgi:arylsulfatase A-like enzyme
LDPYDPLHQGFDVDVPGYWGPGPEGRYVAPWKFPEKLKFQGQNGEHVEDRMAREAVTFMRQNKDRPFFLNYWAFSVHAPWDAKPEVIAKYAATSRRQDPQHNPLYAAMVESLDDAVGTLIQEIDELGLADNTVIIFYSDNGGVNWAGAKNHAVVPQYKDLDITSNAPLRGGKATLYEGGTRVPLIVVWPGVTRPATTCDALVQSVDFYPTLLEVLGLRPRPGQAFDGISIVPALKGNPLQRNRIFCHFPHYISATGAVPGSYVREGDWKLIRLFCDNPDQTDRFELYNLNDDLGETKNLAAEMPEKVRHLNRLIDGFLKESQALVPVANPAYKKPAT